jgi:hypothetical protein
MTESLLDAASDSNAMPDWLVAGVTIAKPSGGTGVPPVNFGVPPKFPSGAELY